MSEFSAGREGVKAKIAYGILFVVVAAGAYGFHIWRAFGPAVEEKGYDIESVPPLHRIEFYSHEIESHYVMYVQVPHGYETSDKRYPVFYQIDGRVAVNLYNDTVLPLLRREEMPEAIFVTVDAARRGNESYIISTAHRRDWTFQEVEAPFPTGGGLKFLAFLRDRVGPFIDATYRTVPGDRGIGGYQMSARFCLVALFTEPESFSRYIVLDPSMSPSDSLVWEMEEAFAAARPDLDVRLYMGMTRSGSYARQRQRRLRSFADTMYERGYEGLVMTDEVVSGETQLEEVQQAAGRGLAYVYGDRR